MLLSKTLGWPKEFETFLKNLCCCFQLSCCVHIESRSSSTFLHRAHFCVTFMADFISFTITGFITLHNLLWPQISFYCTSIFYHKLHFSLFHDSFCLDHEFHLVGTSIANSILFAKDITDFILRFRDTLMSDIIWLTTSYHRFHVIALATFTTNFTSQISLHYTYDLNRRYHFSLFQYSCWIDHISTSIADFISFAT